MGLTQEESYIDVCFNQFVIVSKHFSLNLFVHSYFCCTRHLLHLWLTLSFMLYGVGGRGPLAAGKENTLDFAHWVENINQKWEISNKTLRYSKWVPQGRQDEKFEKLGDEMLVIQGKKIDGRNPCHEYKYFGLRTLSWKYKSEMRNL